MLPCVLFASFLTVSYVRSWYDDAFWINLPAVAKQISRDLLDVLHFVHRSPVEVEVREFKTTQDKKYLVKSYVKIFIHCILCRPFDCLRNAIVHHSISTNDDLIG
jgi:hypothetical protein